MMTQILLGILYHTNVCNFLNIQQEMYHNIGSLPHFDAPPIFITRLTSVIIIFLIVVSVSVAKIV